MYCFCMVKGRVLGTIRLLKHPLMDESMGVRVEVEK